MKTDILETYQEARLRHTALPLWNGDGWLQSDVYDDVKKGKYSRAEEDRFGFLVSEKGSEAMRLINTYSENDLQRKDGDAYRLIPASYAVWDATGKRHRIDIQIPTGLWNCTDKLLGDLGISYNPYLSLSERPLLYPVWRTDHAITRPQQWLLFEKQQIAGQRKQYPAGNPHSSPY